MVTTINIREAKAHFSHYARKIKAGETIILCDRNRPFAEIRPLPGTVKPKKRQLGKMKGQCTVPASFFKSDSEITSEFESSVVASSPQKGPHQ